MLYFYRPVHPSWAWIIVFHSWSCRYETKSGKSKSLKMEARQAKPTHVLSKSSEHSPLCTLKSHKGQKIPPSSEAALWLPIFTDTLLYTNLFLFYNYHRPSSSDSAKLIYQSKGSELFYMVLLHFNVSQPWSYWRKKLWHYLHYSARFKD